MKRRFRYDLVILLLTVGLLTFFIGWTVGTLQPSDEIHVVTSQKAGALQLRTGEGPSTNETAEESSAASESTTTFHESNGSINLNTATAAELIELPGIGEVLAEHIITYREANGAFSSVDELLSVDGIGIKKLEAIRNYVTVEDTP